VIFLRTNSLRTALVFVFIMVMFLVCSARIVSINNDSRVQAGINQHYINVNIASNRGRIFDCNGNALTGEKYQNVAVITPNPQTVMYCSTAFFGEEKISVLGKLKNGKPAVVKDREISCAGVINVKVPLWENDGFCAHILGYTDSSMHGVSGLEKALDKYLYSDEKISVKYAAKANGEVLSGIEPEVFGDRLSTSGVITTIDRNVQTVIENSATQLEKGAIVVSECKTGKIRGMLSRPTFNLSDINESIDSEDSPFLNRALSSYNVGSAFKPLVASINGYEGFVTECNGSTVIGKNTFFCHDHSGHGRVNMGEAIINSCNTYFYRFSLSVGKDKIYETATLFGFGYNKTLCDGISTIGETIPDRKSLESNSALANFSIGQGSLLASPVTMLSLYSAIACDGEYRLPILLEAVMENATVTDTFDINPATKAMSKEKASMLKGYLKEVVTKGTGRNAFSEQVEVAGKTATAQTGWKDENGNFKEHSWFCGFFPADNPEYTVVVLVEDSANTKDSATGIFREIAEGLSSNSVDKSTF